VTELLDIVQKFGEDVAVPENPEREGSPRLITINEIAEEHGVSRSSVHTYRRSSTFPQPVSVEGSTKIRYHADEVAAWFEANPKQQGKKRRPQTDLAPADDQGEEVTKQHTEARPLSGDAQAILGIVWKWIADANDGYGSDVGDLMNALEEAGYGPPPETQE
jgi:predicted DNA-binding transcriptional regulator AlpA